MCSKSILGKLSSFVKIETFFAIFKHRDKVKQTIMVLEQLFKTSGCKDQICEQCEVSQIAPNDFKLKNYNCMQAMAQIG